MRRMYGRNRRIQIAVGVVRVVRGIGERIAMIEEVFDQLDRDRKAKALAKLQKGQTGQPLAKASVVPAK